MGDVSGRGMAHSIAHPWVPISSPLTHSYRFFQLIIWLQKRFRPSDPNTMTYTALEATASSAGKMTFSHVCALLWLLTVLQSDFNVWESGSASVTCVEVGI